MFNRLFNSYNTAIILSFLALTLVFSPAFGQETSAQSPFSSGDSSLVLELQVYPAGQIFGFTFERFFSARDAWHVRLGGQRVRHGDLGEFDDERGNGFGGSVGYRRYWSNGLSLGARVDLWQNSLDWIDAEGTPEERRGNTDVTVLQPTVEVAWRRLLSAEWFIQPSLALGAEINIRTRGEDTGQGFIPLLGLSVGRNFW